MSTLSLFIGFTLCFVGLALVGVRLFGAMLASAACVGFLSFIMFVVDIGNAFAKILTSMAHPLN